MQVLLKADTSTISSAPPPALAPSATGKPSQPLTYHSPTESSRLADSPHGSRALHVARTDTYVRSRRSSECVLTGRSQDEGTKKRMEDALWHFLRH